MPPITILLGNKEEETNAPTTPLIIRYLLSRAARCLALASFILFVVTFGKHVLILLLSNAAVANNEIRLRINCHRNQKVRRKVFSHSGSDSMRHAASGKNKKAINEKTANFGMT